MYVHKGQKDYLTELPNVIIAVLTTHHNRQQLHVHPCESTHLTIIAISCSLFFFCGWDVWKLVRDEGASSVNGCVKTPHIKPAALKVPPCERNCAQKTQHRIFLDIHEVMWGEGGGIKQRSRGTLLWQQCGGGYIAWSAQVGGYQGIRFGLADPTLTEAISAPNSAKRSEVRGNGRQKWTQRLVDIYVGKRILLCWTHVLMPSHCGVCADPWATITQQSFLKKTTEYLEYSLKIFPLTPSLPSHRNGTITGGECEQHGLDRTALKLLESDQIGKRYTNKSSYG